MVDGPTLSYRLGLVIVRGVGPETVPPWLAWDDRLDAWVAAGNRYPEARTWADAHGVTEAAAEPTAPGQPLYDVRAPRDYQLEALARWEANGRRGHVVLPTGSGKTLVALLAIDHSARAAAIIAPTRALLAQWFTQLADAFGVERVGAWYGDEKEVRPITITTYHSAFALLERFGARFPLLVLDEAHHLADREDGESPRWADALRIAPSSARLGLTATWPDGRDQSLHALVGPVVYRRRIGEMTDAQLAGFATERRYIALTPGEAARYAAASALYESHHATADYAGRTRSPGDAWRLFVGTARRDPVARRAYRAFLERERIVQHAERKFDEAVRLLRAHPAEQAILFCGTTDTAVAASTRLAIPMITAETPASERRGILARMHDGSIRAVASVRVLDEGWDVPGAKLGIVLGDSTRGGERQHVQRLGRLLRRQGEAVASFYEIIAAHTHEFYAAQKRGAAIRRVAESQLGFGL
ncbi:MAG: DEAD/DEAH box helicase [Gemmatimonadaceae bacterium]|jgi:superfamily II DNA or RNA helicase|nr:DEAD/DEAH box helicase [Gemmatimonadaceae bacterium]